MLAAELVAEWRRAVQREARRGSAVDRARAEEYYASNVQAAEEAPP